MSNYEKAIKPLMKEKRFYHSVCVAKAAVELAEKFGENKQKAYIAGILHDCRKEADKEQMKKEMLKSGFSVDSAELKTPKLWHGIAGAYYAKTEFKVDDDDILNAIRFHTVGRAYMSKLEKIIYLADMVSDDRDYPDVEKYRKIVFDDLDKAMYVMLQWSLSKTVETGGLIPACSVEAFNYYNEKQR